MKYFIFILIIILFSCQQRISDEKLNTHYLESINQKKWAEAITSLNELIKRHPNQSIYYYARAISQSNLKDKTNFDEMIKDLDKAISIHPDAKYFLLRFQVNLLTTDFQSALNDIELLIQMKGELPFLLSWKGNCAFCLKNFKIAENAYDKRLKLGGQYEEMRNNYYYWIFSKYFGGNKSGALWDCAFLETRGLKDDPQLCDAIQNDLLKWEDYAAFEIPEMTIEQIENELTSQ